MTEDNLDPNASDNLDPDPNDGKTWRDEHLSEELRGVEDLKKFEDVSALAQSYINASQLIGRDKIPMPKSETEWSETYNRLGRPAAAEDYKLNVPENYPENLKAGSEKAIDWFKTTAHEVGLNTDQAGKFFSKYTDLIVEQTRASQEMIDTELAETKIILQTEFGDALPAKMVLANRAIEKFGGEELIKLFAENGMGRDPRIIKTFINVGEVIAEDVGLDKHGDPIESPGDLDTKISELQNRPAYFDAMDPAHKSTVTQVETLMKRRHPKPPVY